MTDFTPDIEHEPENMRFVAVVDGAASELSYRLQGRRALFVHTEVPPRLRGHGLAAALVRKALAWAATEGYEVVPVCSYVQTYLDRQARRSAV